jgi:hypothetical protein
MASTGRGSDSGDPGADGIGWMRIRAPDTGADPYVTIPEREPDPGTEGNGTVTVRIGAEAVSLRFPRPFTAATR